MINPFTAMKNKNRFWLMPKVCINPYSSKKIYILEIKQTNNNLTIFHDMSKKEGTFIKIN